MSADVGHVAHMFKLLVVGQAWMSLEGSHKDRSTTTVCVYVCVCFALTLNEAGPMGAVIFPTDAFHSVVITG